jgi:hypothetical protein
MALTWFFEGRPRLSPRTLCSYCRTLARVMQSSESPSDLAPSEISSHIFRTLDNGQMGMVLTDFVMMTDRRAEIPHAGQRTPGIITHWIEDVAAFDS